MLVNFRNTDSFHQSMPDIDDFKVVKGVLFHGIVRRKY